ncbi:unnamed protein product [Ilex paraguariensis]|uniref:Phytocyanin domain-containing protein n=1 Tax=Ilex paraguariensis TaxID=185542 RepID=A0ABC8T2R0_9AQUA
MASHSLSCSVQVVVSLIIFSSLLLAHHVSSFEFQVGDKNGWGVPPANDSKIYNTWASHNRFKVGDTICFKYRKDSVMQVNVEGYKNCNSTRPNFFSNTGNTIFNLDHAGLFYFISGAAGHCERGQRMIVRVLAHEDSLSGTGGGGGGGGSSSGSRVAVLSYGVAKLVIVQLVLSYTVSYIF